MKKIALLGVLFVGTVFCNGYTKDNDEDDPRTFFPSRPKHAKLHKVTGILEDYGIGNHSGGVSIKLPDGKEIDFLTGAGTDIGSSNMFNCTFPLDTDPDDLKVNCNKFILGKTKVVVTYWYQKYYINITDTDGTVTRYYNHYTIAKVTDQVNLAK